jgi:hypothetical protein
MSKWLREQCWHFKLHLEVSPMSSFLGKYANSFPTKLISCSFAQTTDRPKNAFGSLERDLDMEYGYPFILGMSIIDASCDRPNPPDKKFGHSIHGNEKLMQCIQRIRS